MAERVTKKADQCHHSGDTSEKSDKELRPGPIDVGAVITYSSPELASIFAPLERVLRRERGEAWTA